MTRIKHTSGLWHTRNNPGDWGLGGAIFIEDVNNNVLATIDYRTPYCTGESPTVIEAVKTSKSNAQMMATSPEMLDALKAFVYWYEEDSTEFNRDTAFFDAKKAIAKAEGK